MLWQRLIFWVFLLSRQFHQQAGASILHLSFLFRDEGIYTWETVDGGVCSVHWTGLVALAWLDGGWSGCIWTVGGFTGHSFRTFSSLSLTRELEYPLLSICICCSALLRHIYSSIATYRLSLFWLSRSREWERKCYDGFALCLVSCLDWFDGNGMMEWKD